MLVTAGATEAIAAAVLGLVEPGDEVISLEPYFDSYVANIAMAGGQRVPVTLRGPDFRLPIDELRAAVTDRTRVILLNTPHNPTGTVLNRAELAAVADVAIAHDLVVISDEVYEHLVYDGEHVPIATLPGMRERTVTISSGGKTFSFTGWKIGWACAPPDLLAAVRTAKQFLTYVSGAPFQPAIAHGLGPAGRVLRRPARRSARAPRPALRRPRGARLRGLPAGGDVLRDDRHPTAGAHRRDGVLPRPAGEGRGRRDPDPGFLRRRRGRAPPRPLGVLQAPRGAHRRARPLGHCLRGLRPAFG